MFGERPFHKVLGDILQESNAEIIWHSYLFDLSSILIDWQLNS